MPTLPPFDQEAMDRRFVWEAFRLQEEGHITSFRELAAQLGAGSSLLSQIEAGKYHANQRLLYELARLYPMTDVQWILLGEAGTQRPEPEGWPVRKRGRVWPKKTDTAAVTD